MSPIPTRPRRPSVIRSEIVERDPIQVSPVVDQPPPSDELFRFMNAEEVHSHKEMSFYGLRGIIGPLDVPFDPEEWVSDETTLNQIVIRCGNIAQILKISETCKVPKKVAQFQWMFINAQWSPLGTYLLTFGHAGVTVWGVTHKRSTRLMRYLHSMAREADFSPNERYLVTYTRGSPSGVDLKIFEVHTGEILMGGGGGPCPVIRWSGGNDDKFFATLSDNSVSVYDTDCVSLSDIKPVVKFDDHIVDMCWSPTDPILALIKWDREPQSFKLVLLDIPTNVLLMQKNLNSVNKCKMYWQSNGEYLAVQVDSGFELITINDGGDILPMGLLTMDNILAFSWEPNGDRFAVIHGDRDVSFYSVEGGVSKLTTLRAKEVDALLWSPRGQYIILSGLKSFNGKLEFFKVETLESFATGLHFGATDVSWDATGSFVTTSKITETEDDELLENSSTPLLMMWSLDGELLPCKLQGEDHIWQLGWRPYGESIDELMDS